jgi:hypothetical protein
MMAEYAQDAVELTPELVEFGSMLHKARNGQFESFTEGEREKFVLLTSIANEVLGAVREEFGDDQSPELVGRIVGFLAYEITVTALVAGVGSLVATPTGGAGIALFRSMAVVTTKLKKLGPLGIKIANAIETGALTAKIQKGLKAPKGARGPLSAWDGFDEALAGGPVRELTTNRIKVTGRGIDVVEHHIGRFGPDKANSVMVDRLRRIANGELTATAPDLNFYSHELREFVRYRRLGWKTSVPSDVDAMTDLWRQTHTGSLLDYGLPWQKRLSDPLLYHPDALKYLE